MAKTVLVVDDNPSIHNDFRRILQIETEWEPLALARSALFDEAIPLPSHEPFEVDCVDQGQAALAMVQYACEEGEPYAVAFVDMRMPPGWDGLEKYRTPLEGRCRVTGSHLYGLFRSALGRNWRTDRENR